MRRTVEVIRTYLEMTRPDQLRREGCDAAACESVRIEQVKNCPASFFRYLYAAVGRDWNWYERLHWRDDELQARLASPGLSLHVMYVEGAPAGYVELLRGEEGATEIAYFGVLPEFIGRGLGKYLLAFAVERAWADGAQRVWLHTCTLDAPQALPNYRARGFVPCREEMYTTEIEA